MKTQHGRTQRNSLAAWMVAGILVFSSGGAFAAGPPQQRLSWQEFSEDPKRVASLRKAVATMKSRSTADRKSKEYRTSWEYWANMHGYLGPGGQYTKESFIALLETKGQWDADTQKTLEGFSNITPPDELASQVWGQCPHNKPTFLSWHRMYLSYFERVLRAAAGDDTLRLPYWDYSNLQQLSMPVEFTAPTYKNEKGESVPNPLYDTRRDYEDGQLALAPEVTENIDDILGNGTFDGPQGFQSRLEQEVHGNVHCAVKGCKRPIMGAVALSANDPIFWLHHANIDRFWECWLSEGHQNPASGFGDQSFRFVDENGALVTRTVKDMFGPGSFIDYAYDHVTQCGRAKQELVAAAPANLGQTTASKAGTPMAKPSASKEKPAVITSVSDVQIGGPVVTVPMKLPKAGAPATQFKAMLKAADTTPKKAELVLDGITYKASPGSMFNIFLQRKSDAAQRQHVGMLNFFSASEPGDEHHTAAPAPRVFDVTEELRALAGPSMDTGDITIVFEATTGRASSTPEKAMALFKPDISKLVVKKIELRVSPK